MKFWRLLFAIGLFGTIAWLLIARGCAPTRNYLLDPVTDEEAEAQEALHNRGA